MANRMLLVTAGNGIGVAMIVENRAMVMSGGYLGDARPMILDAPWQLRCRLGYIGCLEALVSD